MQTCSDPFFPLKTEGSYCQVACIGPELAANAGRLTRRGGRNRKLLHNSFDRSSKGLQCRTAAVPTPASPASPQPRRRDNAASLAWTAMQPCLCSGPRCVCVTPKMRPAAKRAPREKVTRRNLPTEGSDSLLRINQILTQTSVGHVHIMMTMQVPSVDVKLNILVLCKS